MLRYIVRRILWTLFVLWAAATVTFALMHATPGSPWDALGKPGGATGRVPGEPTDPAMRPRFEARYGLDKPFVMQYLLYLGNVAQLDFGESYYYQNLTVTAMIARGLAYSVPIGVCAFLLAISLGVSVGALGALRHDTWIDHASRLAATVGAALPSFVLGTVALVVFAVQLGWVPVLWTDWRNYLLPAVVLALGPMALLARLTRASMLEVLGRDHVRAARAKGLAGWVLNARHVAPGALIVVLTMFGPVLATLIVGSVIVEHVFAVPGTGYLFLYGIVARDYPVIMGTTLFYALLVTIANLAVDLVYGLIDPRIRLQG